MAEQLICNQQVDGSTPFTSSLFYGGIPERPKGADCKSVVFDFAGPNPASPTKKDCNFDTKLQSFLTKSAFVGINPLRGWNRYAMKSALRQVRMADLISSEVAHRRFHPNPFGFHPAKQDFIIITKLNGIFLRPCKLFLFLFAKYKSFI